ncbi:MAG: RagB/SusD family nutrient uptake outer membrane protein [Porphyromonadaceae bacterium]|nr:RagB/SusD family nutrient uptake outer membrane protein [Porphyromonadaceae bacterium]
MKQILNRSICLAASLLVVGLATSCSEDGILDRKPLDEVGPKEYYKSSEQLSSFTINCYRFFPSPLGSWGAGMASWDNGTDNQAAISPNRHLFSKDEWKVQATGDPSRPGTGALDFNEIRDINWFLQDVEPKIKAGTITGDKTLANNYLGEAYFFRAYLYYSRLKTYGDFPIVKEPLEDKEEVLVEHAKRMPRNEVARFILADLDKAIELLPETTPMSQRLTKKAAHLFRSRVALFEATFEKYHRGSGRVPGDDKWPGKDKEWNKGKTFDIDKEIKFFLTEAMKSAKLVGDSTPLVESNNELNPKSVSGANGWNPYYDMFATTNPSSMSEVILWKQYSKDAGLVHHTTERLITGSATGWTRGLVESFLMENGLPIYHTASGYKGDETVAMTKQGRDLRLKLFMYSEGDVLDLTTSPITPFTQALLLEAPEVRETTGYRQRKGRNYHPSMRASGQIDQTATIIFRGAEAYLNYIEASYLLGGNIDETARTYWTALRKRAGISAPIETTISATNMAYEANVNRPSYDWGAFSASYPVDQTLYSIRRERRCELSGEGYRLDDLLRWRAMDQVKNYQIEGANFWTKIYDYPYFKDDKGNTKLISDGGDKAQVSSKDLSIYLHPYQIRAKNNNMFNGYTFYQAHYLAPFAVLEMQLASPDKTAANSNLYQNPGWLTQANTEAQE